MSNSPLLIAQDRTNGVLCYGVSLQTGGNAADSLGNTVINAYSIAYVAATAAAGRWGDSYPGIGSRGTPLAGLRCGGNRELSGPSLT